MCCRGDEDSSLCSFGANKPLGFAIFLRADAAITFCLSLFFDWVENVFGEQQNNFQQNKLLDMYCVQSHSQ